MRLIPETHFDFTSRRRLFFGISGVLLLASIITILVRGFNYGVDFTGGALLQVHFDERVSIEAMRSVLAELGAAGATIQQDEKGDFLIRVGVKSTEGGESFNARFREQLARSLPNNRFEIVREEMVGPQVSKELQGKVLLAVALGLVGILIYVSFRFDLRFGVGAALALLHDAIITLGVIAMFNREVTTTTLAALLTVIGYSVNDSIVVSDRIRESIRKMRKETFADVVNLSINQTLSRTVITSLTVLFVTVALLVFGAASIRDFAFVMTVGTVVGTYSSVFVVANLVVEWETAFPSRRRR